MVVFQDRVPRYPGRVTMIPVSGQANTYDLARADDPVVDGTKINAALFEGFQADILETAAEQSAPKIGDIKVTTRTDLGENWVLCNGEGISAADYPEVAGVLVPDPVPVRVGTIPFDMDAGVRHKYIPEKNMLIAFVVNTSSKSSAYLYYTQTPFDPNSWQQTTVAAYVFDVAYDPYRNIWVACGRDTSGYGIRLWYTANDNVAGKWSYKLLNGSVSDAPTSIMVTESGYGIPYGYSAQYWYTPNVSSTGQRITLSGTGNKQSFCTSKNGVAYFLSSYNNSYTIRTAVDISSADNWVETVLTSPTWDGDQTPSWKYMYVTDNGQIFFTAGYGYSSANPLIVVPSATSTTGTILTQQNAAGAPDEFIGVGNFVGIVLNDILKIYSATADAFTFTSNSVSDTAQIVADASGLFGVINSSEVLYNFPNLTLPTITLDGAYAYIKVKEDE